jgi:alpha-beta hydrolase superfamily lysophospholipase
MPFPSPHATPPGRATPPAPPLFVLGHSHGGLVAAAAGVRGLLARAGVAGCILSAPYLCNALPVSRAKVWPGRRRLRCALVLRIPSGVSRDAVERSAMIDAARRDPLLLAARRPWFRGAPEGAGGVRATAGRFAAPLLVLQGAPIRSPTRAASAAFPRRAGSPTSRS